MEDIIEKTIDDLLNGNLALTINQSIPISVNYDKISINNSMSGITAFVTSEERLKKQEAILKKIPFERGSGQVEGECTNNNWLF